MSIFLNYAALSDVGLVRKNNQDAGYASQNLLVLADGMGGAAAGDVASSVTVGRLAEVDDTHTADDLLPTLRKALVASQQELAARVADNPSMAGLGTTCIAIMRANNKLAMTHIGDSRAYLLRNEHLTQVTHDHTLVQYLVDHGELTPEEAAHHPKRNVIMRAISETPESVDLDESIREAIPGDRWLLCSDGLFGVVSTETIKATLIAYPDVYECAEVLISLALAGGAPDNVTVVLADVCDDAHMRSDMRAPSEPMVVGSAAVDYSRPSRAGSSAAGKAAALLPTNNGDDEANVTTAKSRKKSRSCWGKCKDGVKDPASKNTSQNAERSSCPFRRIALRIGVILAVVALLAGGTWAGYAWTQTQYFVGRSEDNVAIFQGIQKEVGPLKLYHLEKTTDLKIKDLNKLASDRLKKGGIIVGSLEEAQKTVEDLRKQSDAPKLDKENTPTNTQSENTQPKNDKASKTNQSNTGKSANNEKPGKPNTDESKTNQDAS